MIFLRAVLPGGSEAAVNPKAQKSTTKTRRIDRISCIAFLSGFQKAEG
jgi:hypothetical protein